MSGCGHSAASYEDFRTRLQQLPDDVHQLWPNPRGLGVAQLLVEPSVGLRSDRHTAVVDLQVLATAASILHLLFNVRLRRTLDAYSHLPLVSVELGEFLELGFIIQPRGGVDRSADGDDHDSGVPAVFRDKVIGVTP